MTRHVGGSILPSSDPGILRPLASKFGVLQVQVMAEEDTHGLFLDGVLLAEHPNGYSCRELARRFAGAGDAQDQADYIVRCGGRVAAAGLALLERVKEPSWMSARGGKWHISGAKGLPRWDRVEKAKCGVSFTPLNVTWNEKPPTTSNHQCANCVRIRSKA